MQRPSVSTYTNLFADFEKTTSLIRKRITQERENKDYLKQLINYYWMEMQDNPNNDILLFLEKEIEFVFKGIWKRMSQMNFLQEEKEFSAIELLEELKPRPRSEGYSNASIKVTEDFIKKFKGRWSTLVSEGKLTELNNLFSDYKAATQSKEEAKEENKDIENKEALKLDSFDRINKLVDDYFETMLKLFERSCGVEEERATRQNFETEINKLLKAHKRDHLTSKEYPMDTIKRNRVSEMKDLFEQQASVQRPVGKHIVSKALGERAPTLRVPRKICSLKIEDKKIDTPRRKHN